MDNKLQKFFMNVDVVPIEDKNELADYEKIPFTSILALGAGFSSMVAPFQKIVQNISVNTGSMPLYQARHNGMPISLQFSRHDGMGMSSGLYDYSTNKMSSAEFVPVDGLSGTNQFTMPYNPAMTFMALALVNIDRKLSDIQETQTAILEFLDNDKKSKIKGNFAFLTDILLNYKYNWNNKTYKSNMHIKVQDIKQEAEQNIIFYESQINEKQTDKSFLINDLNVKSDIQKIQSDIEYLRLSVYSFAFSSFLEIMLLENFDSNYLKSLISKIDQLSYKYREIYTKCYNNLERALKSSVQTKLLGGIAHISKAAGQAINKIPVISRSQLDENLVKSGEILENIKENRPENTMAKFTQYKDCHVKTFINYIKTVDRLYNKPTYIMFDKNNLYFKTRKEPVS